MPASHPATGADSEPAPVPQGSPLSAAAPARTWRADLDVLPSVDDQHRDGAPGGGDGVDAAQFGGGAQRSDAKEGEAVADVLSEPSEASPAPPLKLSASSPPIAVAIVAIPVWIRYA